MSREGPPMYKVEIEHPVYIDVNQIPAHIRDVLAAETLGMILRWLAREREKEKAKTKEENGK